jgi:hypothetical protein
MISRLELGLGNACGLTDILASLDPSESNESLTSLVKSLGDGGSSLGLSFCTDDGCLTFLLGL